MGKHNALGGREGRSGEARGKTSGAAPTSGNGRRRKDVGEDRPAPVIPGDPRESRGERPEHREHGAWGAAGAWSAPAGRGDGAGRPVTSGPRGEYLDSFPAEPAEDVSEGAAEDAAEPQEQPGTKGRTYTGVAAAAVVTVLAIVVAGNLTGGERTGGSAPESSVKRATKGTASRSDPRVTPPLSYDEKMAEQESVDPDLRLSGEYLAVGGSAKGSGRGEVVSYRLDVEKGLRLDTAMFVRAVHETLNDDRGWGHGGSLTFDRVESGDAEVVLTLASPGTTAEECAKSNLNTMVENVSCDSALTERTMINAYRWGQGAETYGPDRMFEYRQMLINHEVGHRLGHGHEFCAKDGALAPLMMQQTKFLEWNGKTCVLNAWPYP